MADNTRRNYLEPACRECNGDLSTVTPIRGAQLLQGQGLAGRLNSGGGFSRPSPCVPNDQRSTSHFYRSKEQIVRTCSHEIKDWKDEAGQENSGRPTSITSPRRQNSSLVNTSKTEGSRKNGVEGFRLHRGFVSRVRTSVPFFAPRYTFLLVRVVRAFQERPEAEFAERTGHQ